MNAVSDGLSQLWVEGGLPLDLDGQTAYYTAKACGRHGR